MEHFPCSRIVLGSLISISSFVLSFEMCDLQCCLFSIFRKYLVFFFANFMPTYPASSYSSFCCIFSNRIIFRSETVKF